MVHQYKLNGYNIVLDTCSGSVHSVDDVAYDIIELFPVKYEQEIVDEIMAKYGDREDVTEEEVRLCLDDVRSLVDAHKLYTPDTLSLLQGSSRREVEMLSRLYVFMCLILVI